MTLQYFAKLPKTAILNLGLLYSVGVPGATQVDAQFQRSFVIDLTIVDEVNE